MKPIPDNFDYEDGHNLPGVFEIKNTYIFRNGFNVYSRTYTLFIIVRQQEIFIEIC